MPTWDDILNGQRERIAAKLAERKTARDTIEAIASACETAKRDLTDEELATTNAARAVIDSRDAEVELLKADLDAKLAQKRLDDAADRLSAEVHPSAPAARYDEVARVTTEARTYSEGTAREGVSFFRDMLLSQGMGNVEARQRVERHSNEVRVEGEMSARALATGGLAGLVPPQYLVDKYALLARAGRPTANLVPSEPIPSVGMQFQIPRGTTGASVGVQATENSAVSTTDEVWANVSVNVATVAGYAPVSRQSLERGTPGIDSIIFKDLIGAYAVGVDQQVLSGTGSSGQTLGILQTAGVNQATAFVAAATPATFYSKLAGQLNAVETTRFMAPNAIIMHPRRWNWLVSQLDSSNRPLVVPNGNGPFNAIGTYDQPVNTPSVSPVGTILGVPCYTDASVPTSVGSGPEDQVIVMRLDDSILFEDSAAPATLTFEQTAATSLTVTLVAYGYIAFTSGRYPTAVGIVGGNSAAGFGLVAPTF